MPQHRSAEKRGRQNERRREQNKVKISKMKSLIKLVQTSNKKEDAQNALKRAVKYLDQLAVKGFIHKNKAANQKSAMTKFVSKMKTSETA